MPARLAIQARRVHNAWLCLIWIVLFFRPRAKKAMRAVNATTAVSAFTALSVVFGVAGAKSAAVPDHHPAVTPACPKPRGVSDLLRVSCSCGLRLAACPADCLHPAGSLCRIAKISGVRLRRPLHGAGRNAPPKSNRPKKIVTIAQMSQLSSANKHI